MQSLKNKIVLITGASSGIGKACAEQFAAAGSKLILTARRLDRLERLAQDLKVQYGTESLILELDVRQRHQVEQSIQALEPEWQSIDILVNNAGLALTSHKFHEADPDDWETMIDTNVKGLLYVTHAILSGMLERNSGHIINMGSVAGREYYMTGSVYCATKHAVKAISKTLRADLVHTPIRVSEIAPGAVNTEFSTVRWNDKTRADDFYKDFTPLAADDIARSVLFCAIQPAHVNIAEIAIMPTDQASVHYLNRRGAGASQGPFK